MHRYPKLLLFFALLNLLACQSTSSTKEASNDRERPAETPVISTATYYDARGENCDQPDSLQVNCAKIDFAFPSVQTPAGWIDEQIKRDVKAYLAEVISVGTPLQDSTSLEEAAEVFWDYREELKDLSAYDYFTAESSYEVLLNTRDYLTITVNVYTYQGGAHGNSSAFVQTYNVPSAEALQLEDITTDLSALKVIAEAQFRQEQQEAFEQGFEFDDIFDFTLPANFGLTEAGLYCHYIAYEVSPYALGNTVFTIPFSELEGILKTPFDTW